MKRRYEEFHGFGRRKNKANSKPISNGINFIYNTEDCRGPLGLAMTPKVSLKKQSQFISVQRTACGFPPSRE